MSNPSDIQRRLELEAQQQADPYAEHNVADPIETMLAPLEGIAARLDGLFSSNAEAPEAAPQGLPRQPPPQGRSTQRR